MTPSALAELRARLPACELAVYADYGSGTVLGADGAFQYPQEYLDALCQCAARLFGEADLELDHATFLSPTGGRVFMRASDSSTEALCCICAPDAELSKLLNEIRDGMNP
jgi:hypothetical protein